MKSELDLNAEMADIDKKLAELFSESQAKLEHFISQTVQG